MYITWISYNAVQARYNSQTHNLTTGAIDRSNLSCSQEQDEQDFKR